MNTSIFELELEIFLPFLLTGEIVNAKMMSWKNKKIFLA
jgi:hypothetical protein